VWHPTQDAVDLTTLVSGVIGSSFGSSLHPTMIIAQKRTSESRIDLIAFIFFPELLLMNAIMQLGCRFENRIEMTYLIYAAKQIVSVGGFVLFEVYLVTIRACF